MLDVMKGIVVADFTSNVAGPFSTLILRDLGATVVKVEPVEGETVRFWPPYAADGVSSTFTSLNRGKKSIAVNLKDPRARQAVLQWLGTCDVLVESLRPGSMDALGFSWDDVHAVNERLVYTSISAFGPTGPLAGSPGFDAIIQAYSGIMDLTGEPDGPPVRVGTGIVDFGTGMWAALATLAALNRRWSTGEGSQVSATLLGTGVGYLMHHLASVALADVVPRRLGTAQHNAAPYQAVSASDGRVMVGVTSEALWARFCDAVDDGRLASSPLFRTNSDRVANRPALTAAIDELTTVWSTAELQARLGDAGVPSSVVRGVEELVDDEQVRAMGLVQPCAEVGPLPVIPVSFDGEVARHDAGAPAIGSHTLDVLAAAGVSKDTLDGLAADGAILSAARTRRDTS